MLMNRPFCLLYSLWCQYGVMTVCHSRRYLVYATHVACLSTHANIYCSTRMPYRLQHALACATRDCLLSTAVACNHVAVFVETPHLHYARFLLYPPLWHIVPALPRYRCCYYAPARCWHVILRRCLSRTAPLPFACTCYYIACHTYAVRFVLAAVPVPLRFLCYSLYCYHAHCV